MAMVLKNLTVINLGSVKQAEYDLEEGLNLLESRAADEIASAIRLVFNHGYLSLPEYWVRGGTLIDARVEEGQEIYRLTVRPSGKLGRLRLRAYNGMGEEVTGKYKYLSAHCAEQDLCDLFDGSGGELPLRLLQYANEDMYYRTNELSRLTGGLSELRAFRAYLHEFINRSEPELIREGKKYEIFLKKNGRYALKYKSAQGGVMTLSESERVLFRYLCFLRTAEFWRGFEEIRNLHSVKKPLIVKNFLDRLDESIDLRRLLQRTSELDRQVIILS